MLSNLHNITDVANSIAVSVARQAREEFEKDMEEIIEKEGEDSESSSSVVTSQTSREESSIIETLCDHVMCCVLFPLCVITAGILVLLVYSIMGLYQNRSRMFQCVDSSNWWYVCCSVSVLQIINYSFIKSLHIINHSIRQDVKIVAILLTLSNLVFAFWGYRVIHDNCVINHSRLSQLLETSYYHYYYQIAMIFVGMGIGGVLGVISVRRYIVSHKSGK